MARVRFQADADLRQAIVAGALRRQPNISFKSANEAELEGIKDPEVLAIAAGDSISLLTSMPSVGGQQFFDEPSTTDKVTDSFDQLDYYSHTD